MHSLLDATTGFFGYQASGWDGPQYLAIPFGVSMLTLVWVFKESLEVPTAARLRAIAIAIIYGAAAWSPLTFDASWALWLCVLICVIGVAAGIVLRIRSYVFLGTAFLVTSVVANLVRYGIRDPRAGAIFLSKLNRSPNSIWNPQVGRERPLPFESRRLE